MYLSIFNRFPVIQPVSSNAILAHFLHILASLHGYAPGTIAVNVIWMERAFNAGQMHSSIYPSIFILQPCTSNSEILMVANWNFFLPLAFNAPVRVFPLEFREKFGPQKTRIIMGLPGSEDSLTIGWAVSTQYQRVTDRRTIRRTDRRPAYINNVRSMTDARYNGYNDHDSWSDTAVNSVTNDIDIFCCHRDKLLKWRIYRSWK